MRIVLIAGLPASGKTHLGNKIALEQNLTLIDDPIDLIEVELIVSNSEKGIVLCDHNFCIPRLRKLATNYLLEKFPNAELEWIFFENDVNQCLSNLYYRQDNGDDRKVEGLIRGLSPYYSIPCDEKCIPVWRNE